MIAALVAQAGRQAIEPTDTTLGGYPASRFEFGADLDMSSCPAGNLRLWRSPDGENEPVIDRGTIVTVYIVDVDDVSVWRLVDDLARGRHPRQLGRARRGR